jgi:hypothetical protein
MAANPVTSLVVSPSNPSSYYAGLNGGGVMRSQDGGQSWSIFMNNLGDQVIHALVKNPQENVLFALTGSSGLYRCNLDAGDACWDRIGLESQAGADASMPRRLAPGEPWLVGLGETFLGAIDPASSASALASGATAPLLSMVFAHSNSDIAYLGAYGAGIQKSMDGGNSWALTQWGSQQVWNIAVHPQNPDILYATSGAPEIIGASRDGGNSWQELKLAGKNVYALAIPPDRPNLLLAGTDDGVFQYRQGTWKQLGLAGETVTTLSIHPQRSELFVAGTTSGAWISTNWGETWLPGPAELQGIPVHSISFSPHNPELIFYNTLVNGTLRVGFD